jgi:hypothetical protein
MPMEKVQRLGGSGLNVVQLKIESGLAERQPWEERLNQPGVQGADFSKHSVGETEVNLRKDH